MLVDKYSDYSYLICEECGSPGIQRNTGWVVVLCDTCLKERRQ